MSAHFTFTEELTLLLMKKVRGILPSAEKIMGIYYTPQDKSIHAYIADYHSGKTLELNPETPEQAGLIDRFRSMKTSVAWFKRGDIPFDYSSVRKIQIDVFDELENTVLMIGIDNPYDHKKDLIFCYLNPEIGINNMNKSGSVLSVEQKELLGTILFNAIQSIKSDLIKDREVLKQMNSTTRNIIQKYKHLEEKLSETKVKYGQNLLELSERYLADLIKNHPYSSIAISDSAKNMIREFDGDLDLLKKRLKEAVSYVISLEHGSGSKKLILDDIHLDLTPEPVEIVVEEVKTIDIQYGKTIQLLDKLELGAERVQRSNKEITSLLVGMALDQPISAPAISDALKKHRNKILFLLNQYPERWNLIRNEFKPLLNIIGVSNLKSA